MGLVHLQRAGQRLIAPVGAGTGMIGDPSGKRTERQLMTTEMVEANAALIHDQLERFLDFAGPAAARPGGTTRSGLLPLSAIGFMRDVGKHFTVNYMMQKEAVKTRLDEGISYTEFSYMLLQAYDFELHRREGATLQVGGSDQWGNITAGIGFIRKVAGADAHALTYPLFTTASGAKFGKTESGTVWLDAERTSPYRFFQFWVNADDRDVGKFLRYFTLLPRKTIEELDGETERHPERRAAQQALAHDVTTRVHGDEAARVAGEVSALLFGKGDPKSLGEALEALSNEVPFVRVEMDGAAIDARLFASAKLVASKGAARRLLEQGGLYINGDRLSAADKTLGRDRLLAGGHLLLRKGVASTRWCGLNEACFGRSF